MTDNKDLKYLPKTYEVRYVENKQSGLSPAARAKIINRSGSNYLSEKMGEISPNYGPIICNGDCGGGGYVPPGGSKETCKVSGCYETACRDFLCYKHWKEVPSNALGETIAKTALTIGSGLLLGPAAPYVGAAVWGASQVGKANSSTDEGKGLAQTFSDIGGGLFLGGVLDNAISHATKTGYEYTKELTNTKKVLDVIDYSETGFHVTHLAGGISYSSNCPECNKK